MFNRLYLHIYNLLVACRDLCQRLLLISSVILPPYRPRKGITVVAQLRDRGSLSKTTRDFIIALKKAGVPYQTFDLTLKKRVSINETNHALTPWWKFRARKYTHVVEMFGSPFPHMKDITKTPIVFWEYESGFPEAYPRIASNTDAIAMSDFNAEYFAKALPCQIHKIVYPFRTANLVIPDKAATRKRFGFKDDDFLVFFNFNFNNAPGRKNIDGAVRAFAKAFARVKKAKLVFKTMYHTQHPDLLNKLKLLAQELNVSDQFSIVTNELCRPSRTGANCNDYINVTIGEVGGKSGFSRLYKLENRERRSEKVGAEGPTLNANFS